MTTDEDYKPKFQRRRSREVVPEPMAIASEGAPVPSSQRRRGPKVGAQALKLKAPERAGHTRRFVINTPERIAEMENLGYAIVSDPSTATIGLGSGTVERPAGSGAAFCCGLPFAVVVVSLGCWHQSRPIIQNSSASAMNG